MKRIALSSIVVLMLAGSVFAQAPDGLPMNAAEGECFARVLIPDSVKVVSERVVDKKASVEVQKIPAQYETVQERHLVREGTTVYKSVPAIYETVPQTIEIEPGLSKTVVKQVVVEQARVIEETIEPKYEMIDVRKLIAPARTERIEIPATYKMIEKRIAIGGTAEWRPVLCETNTGPEIISAVQAALSRAGHPIAVDGKFGPQTFAAMKAYQLEQGLPVGYLTLSTVERLGVAPF